MKALWLAVGWAMLGCGGAAAPSDGGAEAGEPDASGKCVPAPQIGQACAAGQTPCDRVDPCCTQTVVCDAATQKWKSSGIACVQCEGFACGGQTCMGGTVCLARASGVPTDGGPGPTTYECAAMPMACARDWTCACLGKNAPPTCTLPPSGGCAESKLHVTLSCMGQ